MPSTLKPLTTLPDRGVKTKGDAVEELREPATFDESGAYSVDAIDDLAEGVAEEATLWAP
jgi:hypothetical protein